MSEINTSNGLGDRGEQNSAELMRIEQSLNGKSSDGAELIETEEVKAQQKVSISLQVDSMGEQVQLFGVFDENLEIIRLETGARVSTLDGEIRIEGAKSQAELCKTVLDKLLAMLRRGEPINRGKIRYAIDLAKDGNADLIEHIMGDVIAITNKGRQIKCKTLGQKKYIQALKEYDLVFGVGPAGTGKTYLAVAMAVLAFKNKEVERIILTRPAVEAGEKLGFLPGDLQNKVDPYLRPLYDALYDFLGAESYRSLYERGAIEVAPLAYMRGRTLSNAYIILDEAQNCTIEQMKMFLTRFGEGSRVVVTGDITQIDLPQERKSGLVHALHVLEGIEGIKQIYFTHKDVVRHDLVHRIIRAYEKRKA